jgi:bifunctional lysine-specific demethylase and histidyl-hydroxylase NO66
MVREGQTLPSETYTKTARLQSRPVTDLIDSGRVYTHFAEGATIVLQALHRYWEPLFHFCRELEISLTHPVQVNTYLTPPRARGLDVHYDTHDVFVLQVSGSKLWKVYGSQVDLPLAHQRRREGFPDPGEPQIDVELKPGDCLYIPRGFLHAAETARSESTHMTVGILVFRWMDVLKMILERAGEELFMRDALSPGFANAPEILERELPRKLDELVRWLDGLDQRDLTRSFSGRFWASRPQLLTGQLQQVLMLDSLEDDSVIRRRRGATCALESKDDELVMVLGDRRLFMPVRLRSAVEHIMEHSELRVADLGAHLNPESRLVLVRRLIKEGFLEQRLHD